MRGYYVARVLRERGHEVRQVFTADDRDPLRKLPRTLCDLEGNLVDLGDVDAGALGRNLGAPYTDIPDPFGCCDSYGDHFSNIIQDSADAVDVPIELVSNTDLYERGEFEDVTRYVLENRSRAREVLSSYQDKVDADGDYVPFNPICAECGKITETVTSVDLDAGEAGTVDYRCTDMDAGDRTIDGCGHEGGDAAGETPWRFEWPAQWQILGVDFEPFGKDHAEGSWPSGQDVARNVLGIEPPVPMVYEWFTLDGEPFSSSEGNVILVSDVLELLEPEVLRYFFAKDPSRARDFSIERLDQLVDEFDRFEAIYFGELEGTEDEREFAERVYPLVLEEDAEVREERIRLPYTFAAVLGMFDDPALREEVARKEGIPRTHRVGGRRRARPRRACAKLGSSDRKRVRLRTQTKRDTRPRVRRGHDGGAFGTGRVRRDGGDDRPRGTTGRDLRDGETQRCRRRRLLRRGLPAVLRRGTGPKLGPFLAKVDREFVVDRLRRDR